MKSIPLLFLLSASVFAEYPYQEMRSGYEEKSGSVVEIKPSTPTKSQDGIGFCYGFSATSLLEHYRCKELNINCQNSADFLSTIDVTSYYQRNSLVDGGHPQSILSNIQNSKRKIAREECVQFSALVHQISTDRGTSKSERIGWEFLIDRWNEYKGYGKYKSRNDCVTCLADTIKATLVNVETPKDQIKNAFSTARTLEDFLYKTLLPAQCLDEQKMLEIPPFVTRSFPVDGSAPTATNLSKKIESLLLAGIPVSMGVCGDLPMNGKCHENSGHAISLFGIKEVCSRSGGDCLTMVRVKNSYGQSWQNNTSDGWVELETLAESSVSILTSRNLTWIEKPGTVLPNKTISNVKAKKVPVAPAVINSGNSNGVPKEYSNYKGIWKCPGNAFKDQFEAGCVPMK